MRLSGELRQWNDDRGFGFIAADDGQSYFVHISAIASIATRPRRGDRVSFRAAPGRDGRPAGIDVRIAGANPFPDRERLRRGEPRNSAPLQWQAVAALALVLSLAASIAVGAAPLQLGAAYGLFGLVSAILYALDKQAVSQRRWRISEAQLLGIDLCFGIVGGLLAQVIFRHKTSKPSYKGATLLLVVVHGVGIACLVGGWIDLEPLLSP